VFRHAVDHGALLRPLGDTSYLFPPLTTSRDEIDAMITALQRSLADVMR
jgi:adenosylmethionine-8-amino-7-oxononanoate aminotransferase